MLEVLYGIVVKPIEMLVELIFSLMYKMFGNPGIAIIFVSIVIQFLVLPMYKKSDDMQEQERQKQKKMEHWVKVIKKTFTGDERYMILQTYYRSQKYKPFYALKGSLSLLLQIPFFMAAYNCLSNLEVLKGASFLGIADLGAPDGIIAIGGITINLLPVLMTMFNIVSGIIYTKGFPIKDKVQTYGLAAIFLVLLYNSPSGLVLYWTLNNVFSLLKNVFLKLIKNPGKVLCVLFAVAGAGLFILFAARYGFENKNKTIFILIILVICFIPGMVKFVKKFYGARISSFMQSHVNVTDEKTVNTLFTLSSVVLTLLLGVVIPMSVVGISPAEFVSINYNPIELVIQTLAVFVGINLLWIRIFYSLSSQGGKRVFAFGLSAATVIAIVTFYFFGRDLGMISTYFVYDNYPVFSGLTKLLNTALVVGIIVVVAVLFAKKITLLKRVYQFATIAFIALSAFSFITTYNLFKSTYVETSKLEEEKILTLSKNGQNVIVFMVDRAISGFIPYFLEEKPELAEIYDGFTYYPNTISFGLATNYGTPALFGGYEYTPSEINARKNETLGEKQNESLKVLPKLFMDNNYSVTITDPPYAGYKETPDLSIYNEYEGVKAYNTEGAFTKEMNATYGTYYEYRQKRSIIYYSIMKACPVLVQNKIYNNGDYFYSLNDFFVNGEFLKSYSALTKLVDMTKVTDDDTNNFLMMQNSTTHNSVLLKRPDYTTAMSDFGERIIKDQTVVNGVTISLNEETEQPGHYDTNMAALLRIGEWLTYLKEQGVYDNTRIIIVADHGRLLHQFSNQYFTEELDVEGVNPLLMVKDFNAHGFTTSNEFMTNADVPTLATQGVISNPVNPFTGKAINSDEKKNPQLVTFGTHFMLNDNNGYTLNSEGANWYSVKDYIFDMNNWTKVKEGSRDE